MYTEEIVIEILLRQVVGFVVVVVAAILLFIKKKKFTHYLTLTHLPPTLCSGMESRDMEK